MTPFRIDDPLQVKPSNPRNGWIDVEIHAKGAAFQEAVSYTPNDFVFELATALSLAIQGASGVAVASCELVNYKFTFSAVPEIDMTLLRIDQKAEVMSVSSNLHPLVSLFPQRPFLFVDEANVVRKMVGNPCQYDLQRHRAIFRMDAMPLKVVRRQGAKNACHLGAGQFDQPQIVFDDTFWAGEAGHPGVGVNRQERRFLFGNHTLHSLGVEGFRVGQVADDLVR